MSKLETGKRYSWEYIKKNATKNFVLLCDVNDTNYFNNPIDGIFIAEYNRGDKSEDDAFNKAKKLGIKDLSKFITIPEEQWENYFYKR